MMIDWIFPIVVLVIAVFPLPVGINIVYWLSERKRKLNANQKTRSDK
jgi:hypothetical protein